MKDKQKSKEQLLKELKEIKTRVIQYKKAEMKHKQTLSALRESEKKYRSVYNSSSDAVMLLIPQEKFISGNPATQKIFGCKTEKEFISKKPSDLSPKLQPDGVISAEKAQKMMSIAMKKGTHFFEWTHKRVNGEEFPATVLLTKMNVKGKNILQATVRDITKKKHYDMLLEHKAQYDGLTDLPNRMLAFDRLRQSIAFARRNKQLVALFFVDLNKFKQINDKFGHSAGDALLAEVANRLKYSVRESDTVARLSGDEFLLILSDFKKKVNTRLIVRNIFSALDRGVKVNGCKINITVSIGIALFPEDGKSADILLKNADAAMYRAKDKERNNYYFFKRKKN